VQSFGAPDFSSYCSRSRKEEVRLELGEVETNKDVLAKYGLGEQIRSKFAGNSLGIRFSGPARPISPPFFSRSARLWRIRQVLSNAQMSALSEVKIVSICSSLKTAPVICSLPAVNSTVTYCSPLLLLSKKLKGDPVSARIRFGPTPVSCRLYHELCRTRE
jgi:hypothetical protein